MPIGRKISLFMALVSGISLGLTGVISYRAIMRDVVKGLGDKLTRITDTAVLMVNPKDHEKLVERFSEQEERVEDSREFKRIRESLKRVHDANHLSSDLYTVIAPDWAKAEDGSPLMMFMAMGGSEKTYLGNAMKLHPLVQKTIDTGKTQSSELYSDQEGEWVSAFSPIQGSDGKVAAVLEVDYRADVEVRNAKLILFMNIAIPGALALVLALSLGTITGKKLSIPIVRLAIATKKVAGGNLDVAVEVDSQDEIGLLGVGFNKMISDLKRQRQELKDYADNLEIKVKERTAALAEANRNIAGMVNSVSQGFFMFNGSGEVLSIYSKACIRLLEGEPAGKKFWEVLKIAPDAVDEVRGWVDLVFTDTLDWDSISGLGPSVVPHSERLYVTMQYFPVRNDAGQIDKVVAVATDRTAERDANLRADREKRYAQMVIKLVKNRSAFINFVRENLVSRVESALEGKDQQISEIFRTVHTFKSAAASFSLGDVAEYSHELENELAVERKRWENGETIDFVHIRERIRDLRTRYDALLNEVKPLVGASAIEKGDPPIEVGRNDLWSFARRLADARGDVDPLFTDFVDQFLQEPIGKHVEHYAEIVQTVANRLGKEVAPLEVQGYGLKVVAEPYVPLLSSLVHAVRNAVDHGIESPDERLSKGKGPTGTVALHFGWEDAQASAGARVLLIRIKDDGRGIDPKRILKKMHEQGMEVEPGATDEDIIQYVFAAGFSTANQVTDISGRGVGMDAIRDVVEKMGGKVRIYSVLGAGSELVIRLPERPLQIT
jgi:two-component system chemotaxis sensor kinase CheA